jgi:hypothetical protein
VLDDVVQGRNPATQDFFAIVGPIWAIFGPFWAAIGVAVGAWYILLKTR